MLTNHGRLVLNMQNPALLACVAKDNCILGDGIVLLYGHSYNCDVMVL